MNMTSSRDWPCSGKEHLTYLVSSLLDPPLPPPLSCLKCPYVVMHLGVCHGPSSLWLLSEAMELGTAANLFSGEGPSLTWPQTVQLVRQPCHWSSLLDHSAMCCSPDTPPPVA